MIPDLEEKLKEPKLTFDDRDEFSRQPVAEKIIKLLGDPDIDISPLAIDGQWGSGKTEFCIKLINLIKTKHKDLTPIYVNSYKYDHSDEPFLMLASVIANHLKETESPTDKDKLIKAAIPVGKTLFHAAFKTGVNVFTGGNADELMKAVAKISSIVSNTGIKGLLEDYEDMDKNIVTLKDTLQEIAKDKNIVIFIDELDRCKPTFALSLLERIKHIFNVENVQFVLTTNMEQLGAIVKRQYGDKIDAEEYLSKFFTFKAQLSNNHSYNGQSYHNGYKHFFNLFASIAERSDMLKPNMLASVLMTFLFKEDRKSLRDAERYRKNLKILKTLEGINLDEENGDEFYITLKMLAIYIFTFNDDLSQKILADKYSEEDIAKLLHTNSDCLKNINEHDIMTVIYAFFIIDLPDEKYQGYMSDEECRAWCQEIREYFKYSFIGVDAKIKSIIAGTIKTMQFIR